jgi:hypothetical protein
MKKTLKPSGLLILIGYMPKQLQYGAGGPKEIENLYTRAMLEEAFGRFRDVNISEGNSLAVGRAPCALA